VRPGLSENNQLHEEVRGAAKLDRSTPGHDAPTATADYCQRDAPQIPGQRVTVNLHANLTQLLSYKQVAPAPERSRPGQGQAILTYRVNRHQFQISTAGRRLTASSLVLGCRGRSRQGVPPCSQVSTTFPVAGCPVLVVPRPRFRRRFLCWAPRTCLRPIRTWPRTLRI